MSVSIASPRVATYADADLATPALARLVALIYLPREAPSRTVQSKKKDPQRFAKKKKKSIRHTHVKLTPKQHRSNKLISKNTARPSDTLSWHCQQLVQGPSSHKVLVSVLTSLCEFTVLVERCDATLSRMCSGYPKEGLVVHSVGAWRSRA